MNSVPEVNKWELKCPQCEKCNPWICRICANCGKSQWLNRHTVGRWCDNCLTIEWNTVQVLLITGRETEYSPRYDYYSNDWGKIVAQRSGDILYSKIECAKDIQMSFCSFNDLCIINSNPMCVTMLAKINNCFNEQDFPCAARSGPRSERNYENPQYGAVSEIRCPRVGRLPTLGGSVN